MNGGRVAKRLLAVVLALSMLVTLGLYYNGSPSGRANDRPPLPAAALSQRVLSDGGGDGNDDVRNSDAFAESPPPQSAATHYLTNNNVVPSSKKLRENPRPFVSAAVDEYTCPALGLANTTIDTVAQFSRFEFQVIFYFYRSVCRFFSEMFNGLQIKLY